MNIINSKNRHLWLFAASVFCLSLLLLAYLLEFGFNVIPCPLCILQRGVFWILALLFLVAGVLQKRAIGINIWLVFIIIAGLVGLGLSGWQLWLQQHPEMGGAPCTASINAIFKYYPWLDALKLVLQGSKECAKETFTLFGVTLAQWTFVSFMGLLIFSIILLVSSKK